MSASGFQGEARLLGFAIVIVIALLGSPSQAEDPGKETPGPMVVGERLSYHVHYMGLPAGKAVIEVQATVEWGSRKAYRVSARARSSRLFSVFYRVDDVVESLIDTETLLPLRFEKHLREGEDYVNDEVTLFDHERRLARNWTLTGTAGGRGAGSFPVPSSWDEEGGRDIDIPEGVQDALSSFYYLRRQRLVPGKSFKVPVNADEKNYYVEVQVLRRERLGMRGRAVATILMRPVLKQVKLGGILKEKGDVLVWLTDDERRVPVRIQGKVLLGSITLSLSKVEGSGGG